MSDAIEPQPVAEPLTPEKLRAQIKAINDRVYELVDVPEWNKKIWIRSLTGTEKDAFEGSILVREGKGRKRRYRASTKQLRAKLVVLAVCMGNGDDTPVFSPGDVEWLSEKSGAALDRLYTVAQRLSGFDDDDIEEAGKD